MATMFKAFAAIAYLIGVIDLLRGEKDWAPWMVYGSLLLCNADYERRLAALEVR